MRNLSKTYLGPRVNRRFGLLLPAKALLHGLTRHSTQLLVVQQVSLKVSKSHNRRNMQQLVRVCNMAMASYICSFSRNFAFFLSYTPLFSTQICFLEKSLREREREREETGNGNFLSLNIISQFPGKPPLQTPQRI